MARKLVAAAVAVAVAAFFLLAVSGAAELHGGVRAPLLMTKESRRSVVSTDAGSITSVDVNDDSRARGSYHLEFITMEPSSLFLPVLLHADMLFYVHTGKGRVYTSVREDHEKERVEHMDVERGDVSVVEKGSVFYVQSRPSPAEESLQIHLIFVTVDDEGNSEKASNEAYSIIGDLVHGFTAKILQKGFGVSEETIQAIKRVEKPPLIIPFLHNNEMMETHTWIRRITSNTHDELANKNKKNKNKKFNFFKAKPDVENCNGWSTILTHKDLKALKSSHIEAFMVNLSKGSMTGPHWNPSASEIAIVIHGQGMVQVVCPNKAPSETYQCKETNFRVEEGDVVAVPRHRPMSHMSYNNGSLVLVGFSSITRKNLQWLAGKNSLLQTIDQEILALALNVPKSIVKDLMRSQSEPIILDCTSCAEKLEEKMEEEEVYEA
ncbi:vicilin-like seed storage protein At2g18540 [Curcuma longa]|uniref:vicilin-like seed storage protein At2g18540 n=1 Tax=Curcuma longa TaxID=136217 RepID=UPI003D9EF42B